MRKVNQYTHLRPVQKEIGKLKSPLQYMTDPLYVQLCLNTHTYGHSPHLPDVDRGRKVSYQEPFNF